MSLSIEDLCASLSSSHVGQEAMDLAALQVSIRYIPDTKNRSNFLSGSACTDLVLPVNGFRLRYPASGRLRPTV
jgi:hypothetical protein